MHVVWGHRIDQSFQQRLPIRLGSAPGFGEYGLARSALKTKAGCCYFGQGRVYTSHMALIESSLYVATTTLT